MKRRACPHSEQLTRAEEERLRADLRWSANGFVELWREQPPTLRELRFMWALQTKLRAQPDADA